jgi:hypothetical protein
MLSTMMVHPCSTAIPIDAVSPTQSLPRCHLQVVAAANDNVYGLAESVGRQT